jgi:hypothetical protein
VWPEDLEGIDSFAAFAVRVLRFVTWFTLESGESVYENYILYVLHSELSLLSCTRTHNLRSNTGVCIMHYRFTKAQETVEVQIHTFLTSARYGSE